MTDFSEAICPSCKNKFNLPEGDEYFNHQLSSCNCGASFELVDETDIGSTESNIVYDNPEENFTFWMIRNIDKLTVESDEDVSNVIAAVFWKKSKTIH